LATEVRIWQQRQGLTGDCSRASDIRRYGFSSQHAVGVAVGQEVEFTADMHRFCSVAVWRSGNALVLINEVNLATPSPVSTGMGDRVQVRLLGHRFISVCNQPGKSTQPSTLRGTVI